MRHVLLVVAVSAALVGCAASYGPEGLKGGYSEQQLDANVFRITFKGNITNKQAETDDLALLRAAQVAQDHGFAWFVTSGIAPTGTAASLATNVVGSPASTVTIAAFRVRPETGGVIYECSEVIARLGRRYGHP
jgi:hypothetical protein